MCSFCGVDWLELHLELGGELAPLLIFGKGGDLFMDHSPPHGCVFLEKCSCKRDPFSWRGLEDVTILFYLENPGFEGFTLFT